MAEEDGAEDLLTSRFGFLRQANGYETFLYESRRMLCRLTSCRYTHPDIQCKKCKLIGLQCIFLAPRVLRGARAIKLPNWATCVKHCSFYRPSDQWALSSGEGLRSSRRRQITERLSAEA